ncbi:MAG: HypC/HybG/HupF family hydrogenase formation chaperone [Patescibacteria group bacterium]|nr:HypC/HybG/HupF family hydrogenase formation chaperone [Patescibacteria group bacterium]MDD5566614.1 HypC/HybG/HupF family hydrogenase formation chaperone [Patescibacteria group bacterium]
MCLTVPKKIISVADNKAKVGTGTIDISLVPKAKPGDWVLVNADLAIKKISSAEANKILKLFKNE